MFRRSGSGTSLARKQLWKGREMRQLALLLATLGLGACVTADIAPGTLEPVPEISVDIMREVTRELSRDEYEGRAPGTPGEEKTLAYLVEQFEAAGLQPGNNGSWFQDVPLVEITGRDYSALSVTGTSGAMQFAHGKDYVAVSYRVTPEIAVSESEMVFVGYGINAPEKGWNDYAGIDMTGKTAVILVNDPDYQAQDLEGPFNGRAMTYYGRGPTSLKRPRGRALPPRW